MSGKEDLQRACDATVDGFQAKQTGFTGREYLFVDQCRDVL